MPLRDQLADVLLAERFSAVLFATLAAAGLLLAGLGLYGVMAYTVGQRTGEITVPSNSAQGTVVMLWTFFEQTTSNAVRCLVDRQDQIRKVPIPRAAIPLSVLLKSALDLCANLLAVLVVLLAAGVAPRPGWLELPLLIALLALLAAGTSLLLSALYVRFRDLDQIWTIATQALFFGTPIIYVLTIFSPHVQKLLLANPLATIFTEVRHAIVDPGAPAAASIGGPALLLAPLAVATAVVAAGIWVFRRESPWVVENL